MHHHSAGMTHPDSDAVTQRSCPSNCDAVERLILSRKVAAQVRVQQTGTVDLDTASNFTSPEMAAAWCSHGAPPARRTTCLPAFSILRI